MRRPFVAFLWAMLSCPLAMWAGESPLSDDAAEAVETFLAHPTLPGLDNLLRDHGRDWVLHKGRYLTVNHVNWAEQLSASDREARRARLQKAWEAIREDPTQSWTLFTLADRDYLDLAHPFDPELVGILTREGMGEPEVQASPRHPPGRRLWTRSLDQGTRCHMSGRFPLLVSQRHVSMLDPLTGQELRSLDVAGKEPLEFFTDARGAWILTGRDLFRLDHKGAPTRLQLPEGLTLAGPPLMGPDGLFAPLRSSNDPCTFFMAMWTWPEGRLTQQHRIFTRADTKGRLRGQPWIPGPLDARSFYYMTHTGFVLRCDTMDGQPWELLEYPSREAVDMASSMETPVEVRGFSPLPDGSSFGFKPQDATGPLRLDRLKGELTSWDGPLPESRPRPDPRERNWLLNGKNTAFLMGDSPSDIWRPMGQAWLQVQDHWIHGVEALDERASSADPMTAARKGAPLTGTPQARYAQLMNILDSTGPVQYAWVLDFLQNERDLPPLAQWIDPLWGRLSAQDQRQVWNYWISHRPGTPWPLHGGLNIPHFLLQKLLFQEGVDPPPLLTEDERRLAREMSDPTVLGPWMALPPLCLGTSQPKVFKDSLVVGFLKASWPWWREGEQKEELLPSQSQCSVTEAASFWPYLPARWLGCHRRGRKVAALEIRGYRAVLHIRDERARRWESTLELSRRSTAWSLEDGVMVLDEGEGLGHLLSDTGTQLSSFALLDHGPHRVYSKPGGILILGQRHATSLARLNRPALAGHWARGELDPIESFMFPVVWGSPPRREALRSATESLLTSSLLLGAERLAALRQEKTWSSATSNVPLHADGYFNEPYREELALPLKGIPGGRAYAVHGKEGLLLAVVVPDDESTRMVSRDGARHGDALHVVWDPLNNARFYPEPDDRGMVLGLRDPGEKRPVEPLDPRQPPFGGDLTVRRDEAAKKTIYELLIPWADLGHRLPLRLDLGVVDEDSTSRSWHALGEGISEDGFIPRLMPRLVPAD